MTVYFYEHQIRIFECPKWAEPYGTHSESMKQMAAENGMEIEFARSKNKFRQKRVQQRRDQRGDQPGVMCILSAMEPCGSYKPWLDKKTIRHT